MELLEGGGSGDAFGEDADGGFILHVWISCRGAGGGVAAYDVVIEDGFELPFFGFRKASEVGAAVEALLLAGYGYEDDGGRKFDLAGGEDAGALERDGYSAGVVVGSGGGVVGVEDVGVARVVMASDEDSAGGLGGIRSAEDGVNIDDARGFKDAGRGTAGDGLLRWLDEVVAADVEAVVAGGGDARELSEDPVGRGEGSGAGGKIGVEAGEGAAIREGDKLGDVSVDAVGGDLLQCGGDRGIGWSGDERLLGGGGEGGEEEKGGEAGESHVGIVVDPYGRGQCSELRPRREKSNPMVEAMRLLRACGTRMDTQLGPDPGDNRAAGCGN